MIHNLSPVTSKSLKDMVKQPSDYFNTLQVRWIWVRGKINLKIWNDQSTFYEQIISYLLGLKSSTKLGLYYLNFMKLVRNSLDWEMLVT